MLKVSLRSPWEDVGDPNITVRRSLDYRADLLNTKFGDSESEAWSVQQTVERIEKVRVYPHCEINLHEATYEGKNVPEHWIVKRGTLSLHLGGVVKEFETNSSFHIVNPHEALVCNQEDSVLEFVRISSGY